MRILSITAGAGNMYCGSCLRDNNLAAELIRQGHEVVLVPLYTPTRTDEANVSHGRVFFGGISIYLEQKVPLFRKTPKLLDRLWDAPAVIRLFAGRGVEVDPASLGALTLSMLEGETGPHRKEVDNLTGWLRREFSPDVVTLPYTLLIALARPLKQATGRPVVCTLQGEELFLEGLAEPWKSRCLEAIRGRVDDVDAFIAVSHYEARFMAGYLGIPPSKLHVAPLGVRIEGDPVERRAGAAEFRIGYLARVAPEKGLHVMAEAWRLFRELPGAPASSLQAAGYLAPEHRKYLASVERTLAAAGPPDGFRYWGEVDREGKARFLRSLNVLSLPATYDEPKGLPVLEAMAHGVPVVQPRRGAFSEIIEATGGGLLVEADSPRALAEGWLRVALEANLAAELGRAGAAAVRREWTIERMAWRTAEVYRGLVGG